MSERVPKVQPQEERQQGQVTQQPSTFHSDLWTHEERASLLQVLTENDEVLRRLTDT